MHIHTFLYKAKKEPVKQCVNYAETESKIDKLRRRTYVALLFTSTSHCLAVSLLLVQTAGQNDWFKKHKLFIGNGPICSLLWKHNKSIFSGSFLNKICSMSEFQNHVKA